MKVPGAGLSAMGIGHKSMRMRKEQIIRHQMWNERRNAKKILRHTDVYYCVVVGRLDLDLYPLHLMTDNPLFIFFLHAQWVFFFICTLCLFYEILMDLKAAFLLFLFVYLFCL